MGNETHTVHGRTWQVVGTQPYINRSGVALNLLVWRSGCAVCGAPLTIKTPEDYATSKAFYAKHCDAHKLAPRALGR